MHRRSEASRPLPKPSQSVPHLSHHALPLDYDQPYKVDPVSTSVDNDNTSTARRTVAPDTRSGSYGQTGVVHEDEEKIVADALGHNQQSQRPTLRRTDTGTDLDELNEVLRLSILHQEGC